MMSLVPYAGQYIGRNDGCGLTAFDLENHLKDKRFRLVVDHERTNLISINAQSMEIDTQSDNTSSDDTVASQGPVSLPPIGDSTFNLFRGLFLLCFLGGLISAIAALQSKTERENGNNSFPFTGPWSNSCCSDNMD